MAGVKITDLTPLATAASDDLLYIVDVSDNTGGAAGTSKSIEVGELKGYKVYTALLSQSGTDAPTAIVLENTIGNIILGYFGLGLYSLTLAAAFTLNKTWAIIGTKVGSPTEIPNIYRTDLNTMYIETVDGDDDLDDNPVEIRVYN